MTSPPTLISAAASFPCGVVSSVGEPVASPAWKRRRDHNSHGTGSEESVLSVRTKRSKATTTIPDPIASAALATVAPPIVTVRHTAAAKRPQRQYDPSVPMTREETSAWRAAQRRQRNRASAAACRKRQRDRIVELEAAVEGWRTKVTAALGTLRGVSEVGAREQERLLQGELAQLGTEIAATAAAFPTAPRGKQQEAEEEEELYCTPLHVPQATTSMADGTLVYDQSHVISPYNIGGFDSMPQAVPFSTAPVPVTSSHRTNELHFPILEEPLLLPSAKPPRAKRQQHVPETRARPPPARILSASLPHDTIESTCDDLLRIVPDSCLSWTKGRAIAFPEACPNLTTFSAMAATRTATARLMTPTTMAPAVRAKGKRGGTAGTADLPLITSDEDSDLDEFLLDAVQWL